MRTQLLLVLAMLCASVTAQTDRQYIRQGNRLYHAKDFANAEVQYRKALEKNAQNPQANYNLGCALMMQQKDSAAIVQYEKAAQLETNKLRRSRSFHNMGVICQNHQMYGDAIKAYEQSLRLNPTDDETRYNLALCKRLNKNQQNQQNQQNQNQKDKNGQQDKQEQNKDKDEKQEQKPQPQDQMSKENAERLLDAAVQNEKSTQQRIQKAMQQPRRRSLEKNW